MLESSARPAPRYPDPRSRPQFCPACIQPLAFTPMASGFVHCVACGWDGILACPDCGSAFAHAGPWFYWCAVEHADQVHGSFAAATIAARCHIPR